jgi:hypothetical protein
MVDIYMPVVREKLKLNSNAGDSGSKNCKQGSPWFCRSLRLVGVWSQAVCFCVGVSVKNVASVALDMFTHFIYFAKKLYLYFQCDWQT